MSSTEARPMPPPRRHATPKSSIREQRQFQAGTSTVFLVLQRQTDRGANAREVRAEADRGEAKAHHWIPGSSSRADASGLRSDFMALARRRISRFRWRGTGEPMFTRALGRRKQAVWCLFILYSEDVVAESADYRRTQQSQFGRDRYRFLEAGAGQQRVYRRERRLHFNQVG